MQSMFAFARRSPDMLRLVVPGRTSRVAWTEFRDQAKGFCLVAKLRPSHPTGASRYDEAKHVRGAPRKGEHRLHQLGRIKRLTGKAADCPINKALVQAVSTAQAIGHWILPHIASWRLHTRIGPQRPGQGKVVSSTSGLVLTLDTRPPSIW